MTRPQFPAASARRFHLKMQVSRATVFVTCYLLGLVLRSAGFFDFHLLPATIVFVVVEASAGLFYALYAADVETRFGIPLYPFWLATDVLVVGFAITTTSNPLSMWFLLFLVNTAGTAFAVGGRAATAVAFANGVVYSAALAWVSPPGQRLDNVAQGIGNLMLLYGLSFFLLRGIADLRMKRLEIKILMQEKIDRVAELTRLTETLDERTRELEAASRRLQEADRMKSQFLANMSHELRTPLNSIIGFSEILLPRLETIVDERQHKFLRNIHNSGQHLLALINDILDLSKVEAGKMELHFAAFRLARTVDGVLAVSEGMAGKRGITLRAEIDPDLPDVVLDEPRVKQILYNLVSNAIKFSHDNGIVTIGVRALEAAASPLGRDSVELLVRDQGIGIPPDEQLGVFDEFRQVDAGTERRYGGTGLGLALVKRFAELQGGRVGLESVVDEGSVFRCWLPVDASRKESAPKPKVEAKSTRPTILVVEDDDRFFRGLAVDLEAAGYRAIQARTGEEALRLVDEVQPLLVTLDIVLPGLDGWEVLKAIKAEGSRRSIPVVIVSQVADRDLGVALGADDLFLKPLHRQAFLARIAELASRRRSGAPRALVIDDDPEIHELLREELRSAKVEVRSAFDGPAGLELAARERFDLVVLDLMMPGMSGFEVADELQRHEATRSLPIVVLSARDLSADDRQRLAGRIHALLEKGPGARERLLAVIRELESHRAV